MKRLKVFYSYSHKDEALRDELEKHLSLLRREGHIEAWHDRRIPAGKDLDAAINQNLLNSDIILLLISSDFLASDYCYSKEMTKALEMQKTGAAHVVPVILRHCDWHSAPFGKLNALPPDGTAIKSFADIDAGFLQVVKGLRQLIASMQAPTAQNAAPELPVRSPAPAMPDIKIAKNVQLPKKVTDLDKDQYIKAAFQHTKEFFRNSLAALENGNPGYKTALDEIDNHKFKAAIYRDGNVVAKCFIRLGNMWGGGTSQILYSGGVNSSMSESSANHVLTVECDKSQIFLKTMMAFSANDNLTAEQGAEYLWNEFTKTISS